MHQGSRPYSHLFARRPIQNELLVPTPVEKHGEIFGSARGFPKFIVHPHQTLFSISDKEIHLVKSFLHNPPYFHPLHSHCSSEIPTFVQNNNFSIIFLYQISLTPKTTISFQHYSTSTTERATIQEPQKWHKQKSTPAQT